MSYVSYHFIKINYNYILKSYLKLNLIFQIKCKYHQFKPIMYIENT